MHPNVGLYFMDKDCLAVPCATNRTEGRNSWSRSLLIAYSEDVSSAGKKLRTVMEAASLLVHAAIDDESSIDSSQYFERHADYFQSRLYGSMVLKDKRWTLYCGNDCSPRLENSLAAIPTDVAAGEAFFQLLHELRKAREVAGESDDSLFLR